MAQGNDIGILISGILDENRTEKNINSKLESIKSKIDTLKIKIDIDEKVLSQLNRFADHMDRLKEHAQKTGKVIEEVINPDGSKFKRTFYDGYGGTFSDIIEPAKKAQTEVKKLIADTQELGRIQTRVTKETAQGIERITEKFKKDATLTSLNIAPDGTILSKVTREDLKATDDLVKAKSRLREELTKIAQVGQVSSKQIAEVAKSVNLSKNKEDIKVAEQGLNRLLQTQRELLNVEQARYKVGANKQKEIEVEKRKTEELRHQLSLYKQQAEINAKNLVRQYGDKKIDSVALKDYLQSVKDLSTETPNLQRHMDQLNMKFKDIKASVDSARSHTIKFSEAMKTALVKFPIWVASASLIYAPIRGLRSAIDIVVELDKQLTILHRVMNEDTNFERMMQGNINIAKQLGREITEVAEIMTGFARQGYSENQVLHLTKTATLLQNISELDAEESMSALTASMTIFNIEANRSIEIVDKLNEIDNNFAIDTRNLALALNKSAASATAFNVSLEENLGHITAIGVATRESGQIIGNSLKTIYSRLTTMQPSIDALASVGISVKDSSGEMKSASIIIDELAKKWNTLNAETQQNLGVTLAGRFQLSRFLALMQNYNMAIDATTAALNSEGSAMRENERYMASLEAKIKLMQANWQNLSYTMGNAIISDSIVSITTSLSWMADKAAWVIDKAGALPVVFGLVSATVYVLNASFKSMVLSMSQSIASMFGIVPASTAASIGIGKLTFSTRALTGAFRGLMVSTGIGAVFAGLGLAVEWMINKFGDATKGVKDYATATEELINKVSDVTRLEKLNEQYRELADSSNRTTEEKLKLSRIESELRDQFAITITSIEDQNGAYEENARLIEHRIDLLKEEISLEREKALLDFQKDETNINDRIERYKRVEHEAEKYYKSRIERQAEFREKLKEFDQGKDVMFDGEFFLPSEKGDIKRLRDHGEYVALGVSKAREEWVKATDKLNKEIKIKEEALKAGFNSYIDQMEASGVEIKKSTRILSDIFASVMAKESTSQHSVSIIEDFQKIFEVFQDNNVKNVEDAVRVFNDLPEGIELSGEAIDLLTTALSRANFQVYVDDIDDFGDSMSDAAEATGFLTKEQSDLIDQIQELSSAYDTLSDGQDLSNDQILKLLDKYPELLTSLKNENGQLKLNKEAVEILRNAKEEEFRSTIRLRAEALEQQAKALEQSLTIYGIEADAIDKLARAKEELYRKDISYAKAVALGSRISEIESYREQIESLKALANASFRGVGSKNKSPSSGSKSSRASEPSYTDPTSAIITQANLQAELLREKAKDLELQLQIAKEVKDYNKSIEITNQLLQNQSKAIDAILSANKQLSAQADKVRSSTKFDTSNWFTADGRATVDYVNQFNNASKVQQEEMTKVFNQISQLKRAYMDNITSVKSLEEEYRKLNGTLGDLRFEHIIQQLDEYKNNISDLDRQIAISKATLDLYDESSEEYRNELIRQNELIEQKKALILEEIELVKAQLATTGLSIEQYRQLEGTLYDLELSYLQLQQTQRQNQERVATQIVNLYKEVYRKQRELALKAIDDEMKRFEQNHRNKMKMYDDELKQIQKIIDEKLREIDEEKDEEDYYKRLTEMEKDAQDIRDKIAIKSLNDSAEGRRELAELKEQLTKKEIEIEEFQKDRERDLRKKNLKDLLDKYREEIEAKRESESLKYEHLRESLERQKELESRYWENKIEDERFFAQVREDVLNGHLENIEADFMEFEMFLGDNMSIIGESISRNLIDKLKEALGEIEALKRASEITPTGGGYSPSGVSGGYVGGGSSRGSFEEDVAWTVYMDNKRKAEDKYRQTGVWDDNLRRINQQLRDEWGFEDGSYDELLRKAQRFETGGYTGDWAGNHGKLAILDKKEIVLNQQDTKNVRDLVEMLKDINISKIMDRVKFPIDLDIPRISLPPMPKLETLGGGNVEQKLIIENMTITGDKKGADDVLSRIRDGFKKMGGASWS